MSKEVKTIFNLHKADVNFSLEVLKNPKKYILLVSYNELS